MFGFGKPAVVQCTTCADMELKLKTLEKRIIATETLQIELATALQVVRNKVLKKIQFKQPEEEEEEDKPTSVILPR